MGCCLKIALRNIPASTPAHYFAPDGNVYLDPPKSFQVSDNAAEGNEVGSLKESGVIDSDLPKTQRNKWAVQQYDGIIPVRIMVGGIDLSENTIVINGEEATVYDTGFESELSWIFLAKNTYLRNVSGYQPYIFSEAHVDTIQANHLYNGGANPGYWYPLAYYGGLRRLVGSTYEITFADYRPWFHLRKLLPQASCNAGFKFVCPLLDHPNYGNSLLTYIAGPGRYQSTIYTDDIGPTVLTLPAHDHYQFKAVSLANQLLTTPAGAANASFVNFQDDAVNGYDTAQSVNGGFWKNSTANTYLSNVLGFWEFTVYLKLTNTGATMNIWVGLAQVNSFVAAGTANVASSFSFLIASAGSPTSITVPGGGATTEFTLTFWAQLYTRERPVVVAIDPSLSGPYGGAITVNTGSYIQGKARTVFVDDGDNPYAGPAGPLDTSNVIYFPQSYIHAQITWMQLIEGLTHALSGKLEYNESLNLLTLRTPFDNDVLGVSIPGYYDTKTVDLSTITICDSITSRQIKGTGSVPCTLHRGFKDSTDAYIKQIYGDSTQPYRYTFDLSKYLSKCTDGEKTDNNPFFEPTVERIFNEVKPSTLPAVSVPVLWDNDTHEASVDIAPRIARAHGLINQYSVEAPPFNVRGFRKFWGGVSNTDTLLPYASQLPVYPKLVAGIATPLTGSVVYGGGDVNFGEFAKSDVIGKYLGAKYLIKAICPNYVEYRRFNFRDKYVLKSNGAMIPLRLISKGPFDPCESSTVELELKSREYIC